MTSTIVGSRRFSVQDQQNFAALSGDWNPIHLDPILARRTMAGAPILFGIQTLVWGLDCFLRDHGPLRSVRSLAATFSRFVYVGEEVRAVLLSGDERQVKLQVLVNGIVAVRIVIELGEPIVASPCAIVGERVEPSQPLDPPFEALADCRGHIAFSASREPMARMFPLASETFGTDRIAALARSSSLVGMVCPGLHSLYHSLTLSTVDSGPDDDSLAFRTETDERFARVRLSVEGGGWRGSLVAFRRPEPIAQPTMAALAEAIAADAFVGLSALVIGGSRGLGELVSKAIAAGGGRIALTYATGEADARRVQAEITAFGGCCEILSYDIRKDAGTQLEGLIQPVGQLFYMPTPPIFTKRGALFEPSIFEAFTSFYIAGFYALCHALRQRDGVDIPIFYPSSTAVEQRPRDLTEYAMAKAAGEMLCADMRAFEKFKAIHVARLPRLPTDQTATLRSPETFNGLAILLPIIEAMRDSGRGV